MGNGGLILFNGVYGCFLWDFIGFILSFGTAVFLAPTSGTGPCSGLSICAGSVHGSGARRLWGLVLESSHGRLVPLVGSGKNPSNPGIHGMGWNTYLKT